MHISVDRYMHEHMLVHTVGDSLSVFFLLRLLPDSMLPSLSLSVDVGVTGDLDAVFAGVLLLGVLGSAGVLLPVPAFKWHKGGGLAARV